MTHFSSVCMASFLLVCGTVGHAKEHAFAPDLARINDAKAWRLVNASCKTAVENGKQIVKMKPQRPANTPSNIGLALVEGVEFMEGTLEVDLKGQGPFHTSFVGLAFCATGSDTFEAVYFRPFNFIRDPKEFRSRAVQYVSWPEHTWEKLRAETPGVYEAAVSPIPDPSGWFHARVEVTKQKVKVWVDDGKEPCLVVDRLSGRDKGKVGLWVDSREGTFSNLKIISAK
jgi:hypothetical protein